jgi:phosphohistidine phosphatase
MSPDLTLWLVHHGDALGAEVDAMRPLSAAGRRAVEHLAAVVAAQGARPVRVWHSGKLRARQTAELFWRACNPLAEFGAVRGLQPTDPAEWLRDRLLVEDGELMAVGHMPHLPRLLGLLLWGDVDRVADFPLHGVVCVGRLDGAWVERWRSAIPAREPR